MQSEKNLTLTYVRLKPSPSVFSRAIRVFALLSFIGVTIPLASRAQQNEVVTDQTVVQLIRAGISKQVIMAKIENSQTNFDLSTNGLVFLKNNGVPDDIVATMINKNSNNNAAPAQQQGNAVNPAQDTGDVNAQGTEVDDPNAQANSAPPELPTYEQPPCPTDGYLWQPGYWAFNPVNGYYWVPGVWVAPPQPGLLWTPGYWGFNGVVFVFHRGYWGASVGFYGGINYGYGYAGVGFVGGAWYGHVYRYNTAVVRVNTVVVHNVYVDRTVVHTTVINRVSYNGRGGVVAQPRPEELRAERETHIRATQEQIAHQREASNDRNQFAKVNNGRPTQVATPRVSETAIKNQQNYQQSHGSGDRFGNRGQANNNNPSQPNGNGGTQGNGNNRAGTNANNPNQPNGNGGAQGNGNNRAGNNEQKSNNPNQPNGNSGTQGNSGNEPKTNNPNQPAGNGNAEGNNSNRNNNESKTNNPNQPAGNGGNANNNNNNGQKQAAPKKGGFFNNLRNNAQQHNQQQQQQQQQRAGNNNNQPRQQPKEEKKNDKKH